MTAIALFLECMVDSEVYVYLLQLCFLENFAIVLKNGLKYLF